MIPGAFRQLSELNPNSAEEQEDIALRLIAEFLPALSVMSGPASPQGKTITRKFGIKLLHPRNLSFTNRNKMIIKTFF